MPRVVLGPVAGYADPQGIYMQFIEWFMPAYDDSEWPQAMVSGTVDIPQATVSGTVDMPRPTVFLEPSRAQLFDFAADIMDYGDVTTDKKLSGRMSAENCISQARNIPTTQILMPEYADAPVKVFTPDESIAFIAFKNIKAMPYKRFFLKLFSTTGGELIEAYHVNELFCVSELDLNNYHVYFDSEHYITRKGIQDWHLNMGGGNLLLVIHYAHEQLFIHEVGIQ